MLLTIVAQAQDFLTTHDLRDQIDLSGVELSPDGKQLLVLTSRQDFDSNAVHDELVLMDVANGEQRILTQRAGVSLATWSPQGIVSLLLHPFKVSHVFVLPFKGGEARQITSSKEGILHYSWSPDGKLFALICMEDPDTKSGPERFNDSFEVGSNNYLTQSAAMTKLCRHSEC